MLTLSNIQSFRDSLNTLITQCDELISKRTSDKNFSTVRDYENAKVAQKIIPDEYYKFRVFDKSINLRYHSSYKEYYFYLENCYPSDTYIKLFPPVRKSQFVYRFNKYFISDDFETAVASFILLCVDIANQLKKQPEFVFDYGLRSPN